MEVPNTQSSNLDTEPSGKESGGKNKKDLIVFVFTW